MDAKNHEELRILFKYNKYLNKKGLKRLAELQDKEDREYEERKKD